ncbi:uncharacterized protein LOC112639372 isoform X2 [Camponotus floridanus]|uniref:uncharacterized protein LOC112639372 isoform X2 n=1 Tax=Camponotus floridanus TaxID=104421 RepID=UPI000DC67629|nr:uncharacterized protein LOC112639372 isoform X2 [Camponotus floridanus]
MMSATSNSSRKVCCFCNLTEDDELKYGKFYEYNGIVTHYYCLLLSSNMEQKGNDDEGILGFLIEDIQKELRRGKRLTCSYCKKIGATLGCCNVRCRRTFHFPCGLKDGSLYQYFGEFRSYCINHRPKQQIDEHILKQISPLDNTLCYICYNKVNPIDFVKTLWAPCCKKNAFFHHKCIQQLALSTGYFFKCPLCNNNKDFQNAMLEYGIFIPNQDASWELEPNAFEELLYRHDQCDAVNCLCPKGRKHVSSNAKWELILCQTCGSQGIHRACGQLKWADPVWECTECTSILYNSKSNEDAKSADSSSDDLSIDSDSDSYSDTDISVGMDFPMPSSSSSFNSSSMSLPDLISDIRLRPGPRSFKLKQQLIKCLELTRSLGKDITTKVNEDINASLKNNDKENSLTNNDNDSLSTPKEKLLFSNDVTSQLIRKEIDVVTIDSDDDDDDEIFTVKRRTNLLTPLLTSQSSLLNASSKNIIKSKLNTVENSTSKNLNATSTLLEKDNIKSHKSASKSKIVNKNESIISEQYDVALREFMSDLIIKNDLNNDLDDLNIDGNPFMNINNTGATSQSPKVFKSVPDPLHDSSFEASSSTCKSLEKLVTYILPSKRIYEEENNVVNKCKKIKGYNEKSWEKKSLAFCIVSNANKQQNRKTSPIKTNEICENKNSLKYTSINELYNLSISRKKINSSNEFIRTEKIRVNHLINDKSKCLIRKKENLDSIRSKMSSHNNTFDNGKCTCRIGFGLSPR